MGAMQQILSTYGGGGGGSAPHAYWRIYVTAVEGGAAVSISEIEMRASVGGADQCSGGTPTASSQFDASRAPQYAFDNTSDATFFWASSTVPTQWIAYQFAAPVVVDEIVITAREVNTFGQSPVNFVIQSSDNGSSWTEEWNENGQTGWTPGAVRAFERVPPATTTARYWRIYITANNGDTSHSGFAEIELRGSVSGADLTTTSTPAVASSAFSGRPASNAVNNNTTSGNSWVTDVGSPYPSWIYFDLGSATLVAEIAITTEPDVPAGNNRAPQDFLIQSSDTGSSWTTQRSVTGSTAWGNGTTRTFTVP